MKKINSRTATYVLTLILLFFLNACSTTKVPVTIKRPAEINISQYRQIAIADIEGRHGLDFSGELKSRLVEIGDFKVVDRSRMGSIMRELQLSQSDLSESKNRAKLGRLLNASVLISGYLNGKYKEDVSYKDGTCYKLKEKRPCVIYHRKGIYSTSGSMDVIEVETGEILRSKILAAAYHDTTRATDAWPDAINRDSLYRSCLVDNVNDFLKSIQPWEETVAVPFKKDSAIPELEKGIHQAKMGEMGQAIMTFARAAQAAEGNAKIRANSIAVAYWDLGLAYKYTWQLDNAIEAFKKAYAFEPDDDYINEIKSAEKMKAEKIKLEEQKLSAK